MKNKNQRMDAIKVIISTQEIGCQEDLRKELESQGFNLTQATLSRDLKQLKVAKASNMAGRYVYVLPNNNMYRRISMPGEMEKISRDSGFKSIVFSGNMAVIKTRPGYASSLAYDIDAKNLEMVCGTIAGDDTIFLVMRDASSQLDLIHALETFIPNVR